MSPLAEFLGRLLGDQSAGTSVPLATLPLLSAFPGRVIPVQSGSSRKQSQADSRLPTLEGNVGDLGLSFPPSVLGAKPWEAAGDLRIWAGMRWGSQGQDKRGLI